MPGLRSGRRRPVVLLGHQDLYQPLHIYIYVKDVDAMHGEVKKKGVELSQALQTQWWGDRTFAVKDPYGYTLLFCQNVTTDIKPPPGVKMI